MKNLKGLGSSARPISNCSRVMISCRMSSSETLRIPPSSSGRLASTDCKTEVLGLTKSKDINRFTVGRTKHHGSSSVNAEGEQSVQRWDGDVWGSFCCGLTLANQSWRASSSNTLEEAWAGTKSCRTLWKAYAWGREERAPKTLFGAVRPRCPQASPDVMRRGAHSTSFQSSFWGKTARCAGAGYVRRSRGVPTPFSNG